MPQDSILFAETDDICFIKFIGNIQYTISSGFDTLVAKIISSKSTKDVVFDVNQATHIDSTNLGLMARIARFIIETYDRKPVIICDNVDINTIFLSMGFEHAFIIVKKLEITQPELFELPAEKQERAEQLEMLTGAHRTLMEMNEKNKQTFQPIVQMFENEE
jgi:anti-anti-sigma regulatory factor